MKWFVDLFKKRGQQKKLKVAETAYNNLVWKDRAYLVDLIFKFNDKTKRDVRKLMKSNTDLTKKEIKTIVKLGSAKMKEIRRVRSDFGIIKR